MLYCLIFLMLEHAYDIIIAFVIVATGHGEYVVDDLITMEKTLSIYFIGHIQIARKNQVRQSNVSAHINTNRRCQSCQRISK